MGASSHQSTWASEKGGALSGEGLYLIFQRRLLERAGLRLTLHDARRISATTWAIEDPCTVGGAKDLLGDKSASVVTKHYLRAGGLVASRRMARVIADRLHRKYSKS